MNQSSSEWSQSGFAGGLRERLRGTKASRLGPLLIALAVVLAARIGASNDFASQGFLRDSGRWVPLPVTYQSSLLALEGVPRCEEMIRVDNASHVALGVNITLRNKASSSIHLAVFFHEWSGSRERKSVEFETIDSDGRAASFLLQAPHEPGSPSVPEPQPIAPGITRCTLAVWLVPQIDSNPTIAPSKRCAQALGDLEANQQSLSADALVDDTIRRCASPEDWEAAWLEQVVMGFPRVQLSESLDDELAFRCFDLDRALEQTRVCRALVAQSNHDADAFAA